MYYALAVIISLVPEPVLFLQTTPHFRVHQMFISHMQEPTEDELLEEINKHHYLKAYINCRPMRVLDD